MKYKRIPEIEWGKEPTQAQYMVSLVKRGRHALDEVREALEQAERFYANGNGEAAAMKCGKALGVLSDNYTGLSGVEAQLHEAFGEEVEE